MDRFSETFFSRSSKEYDEYPEPTCDNCKSVVMEDLREVHEYRERDKRFHACAGCYDEIQAALENEAVELERRARILAGERRAASIKEVA